MYMYVYTYVHTYIYINIYACLYAYIYIHVTWGRTSSGVSCRFIAQLLIPSAVWLACMSLVGAAPRVHDVVLPRAISRLFAGKGGESGNVKDIWHGQRPISYQMWHIDTHAFFASAYRLTCPSLFSPKTGGGGLFGGEGRAGKGKRVV